MSGSKKAGQLNSWREVEAGDERKAARLRTELIRLGLHPTNELAGRTAEEEAAQKVFEVKCRAGLLEMIPELDRASLAAAYRVVRLLATWEAQQALWDYAAWRDEAGLMERQVAGMAAGGRG